MTVPDPAIQLSPRELECLLWSARGKTNWDMSMILGISEHTVDFHMRRAMAKLDARTRVAAVVRAVQLGFIVP
jgi:LuxR family quorum-sensing system transcriptional regulator CciR